MVSTSSCFNDPCVYSFLGQDGGQNCGHIPDGRVLTAVSS